MKWISCFLIYTFWIGYSLLDNYTDASYVPLRVLLTSIAFFLFQDILEPPDNWFSTSIVLSTPWGSVHSENPWLHVYYSKQWVKGF